MTLDVARKSRGLDFLGQQPGLLPVIPQVTVRGPAADHFLTRASEDTSSAEPSMTNSTETKTARCRPPAAMLITVELTMSIAHSEKAAERQYSRKLRVQLTQSPASAATKLKR